MAVVAVVAATVALGLVVSAGPLFASTVGTAALHDAAATQCVQDDQIGGQRHGQDRGRDRVRSSARCAAVPTADTSGLLPAEIGLFASPGAADHVHVLSRVPGAGVLVTDTYAARAGLRAGDTLRVAAERVRIAGIYANLDTASYRTVLPPFWCHWRDLIVTSSSNAPPPFCSSSPAGSSASGPPTSRCGAGG